MTCHTSDMFHKRRCIICGLDTHVLQISEDFNTLLRSRKFYFSILLTDKERWQGLKQPMVRILLASPLLGWLSAYLGNLTRFHISAFTHQEMVSVPQSRLTDLLRTETFLSLSFPHPSPQPSLTRKGLSRPEGSLGIRVRLAAPGEWPPISAAAPCGQESGSPGAGGGKREVWGQPWLGFLWQGFLVCAFLLCSTREGPGQSHQRAWLRARA